MINQQSRILYKLRKQLLLQDPEQQVVPFELLRNLQKKMNLPVREEFEDMAELLAS